MDTQYNGLYGEGGISKLYDRVGILLVEVYESVGLSVISLRKKAQKGL